MSADAALHPDLFGGETPLPVDTAPEPPVRLYQVRVVFSSRWDRDFTIAALDQHEARRLAEKVCAEEFGGQGHTAQGCVPLLRAPDEHDLALRADYLD